MRRIIILAICLVTGWTAWCQSAASAGGGGILIRESFHDQPLADILSYLEEKYGLHFAYSEKALKEVRVSCRLDESTTDEAVSRLLSGTVFQYQLVDERHVMIRAGAGAGGYSEAADGYEVQGRVFDALTGAPLAYASVVAADGQKGVATDEAGAFQISLASDEERALTFQYLGYSTRVVQLEEADRSGELTIKLYPQIQEIPGITIEERAPLLLADTTGLRWRINPRQLDGLPDFVGGKDLFRSLQLLPGISASDDLSAGLQIRGGGTEENLIILDGITLYRVDHYYGVFSAVNPSVIGKVDLYKNAFPAQYGGRTSGVLDMQTLAPGVTGATGGAEFNLLTSNAWLQTPVGKNLDLLIGGRISNGDISDTQLFGLVNQERLRSAANDDPLSTLTRKAVIAQTPDFRFYDLNGRLSWSFGAGDGLSLNFFQSRDNFENNYENSFTNVYRRIKVRNTEQYSETSGWHNSGVSFRGTRRWSDRWQSSFNFSRSTFENSNYLTASLYRAWLNRDTTVGISNSNLNNILGYNLHIGNTWRMDDRQGLNFGYEGKHHQAQYDISIDDRTLIKGDQAAWEHALYSQYHLDFAQHWTLRAGIRGTYYVPNRKFYVSPRVQLRVEPVEGLAFQASASRYYQFLREIDYETRFGSFQPFYVLANDGQFPVSASNHFAAGFTWLGNGFGLELEYFDRRTTGALEYALVRTGFDPESEEPARTLNYKGFTGTGHTYGVDVLLRKTSGHYTGWIAYTLSKSTNRFPEILAGLEFPAASDRRHQLQLVNQYRLGRWSFSGAYVFASGRPYTNLADLARLRDRPADRRELNPEDRISYLSDYHRIDLSVQYDFRIGPVQAYAGVSVFNLLNRQNVKYRQYVFAIPESLNISEEFRSTVIGNELQMLDRTVNVRVGIGF